MSLYGQLFKLVLILAFFQSNSLVLAEGGAESMDRPSARPLPKLESLSKEKKQNFILPKIQQAPPEIQVSNGLEFNFSNILIEGNTVLPESRLQFLVQPYEGRRVNVTEIEELRQKITQLYIDEGYINSGAIIAEDAAKNGVLTLKIIQGRLDEIKINGIGRLREGYLKNRLQIDPEEPFNYKNLQERFQLLLSDPLIDTLKGRLLPGATPGHSVLELDVTRAKPYRLTLFGDNYRPPSIGGEAFGLKGQVYNLTGLGGAFDFTFIKSEGSTRYAGGFTVPVTDWGTQAFFHFDEGQSSVIEDSLKTLDIESQVHNLEGGLSQLLINRLNQQLDVGFMLAIRKNETSMNGGLFSFVNGEPTGRNQATVCRIFQNYMQRWEDQVMVFRSTLSFGMNALGATLQTSKDDPSSEFFAWLGQAQYAYRVFDDGSQFVLRGNAQLSDSPLLPLEQISVGGFGTVRGYRENHLVTDNGYSISAEYHWPVIGGSDASAKHRLTLIPFVDFGKAWDHVETDSARQRHLLSVGMGFNWQYKPVSVDLFYGYPLFQPKPKTDGDIQDEAIHFQIRVDAL